MSSPARGIYTENFTTDVFTVPFRDVYILYIPEAGVVAGVDRRVHDTVEAIKQNKRIEASDFNRELVSVLEELQTFAPKADPNPPDLGEYYPTHVTLSLTSRCHLRCVYCYARAGESIRDMAEEMMEAALRFTADNALREGEQAFTVTFHGEGEPTANWHLFERAIRLSEQLAKERGLEVTFTMSSNGMWSRSQREFIVEHFDNLSVSLDGWSDVQNLQRPTVSGAPSFPVIFDNLKFLEERNVQYGTRATVLPQGLDSMVPFLEMVAAELDCDWVHFEPVFLTGRALDADLGENDMDLFFRRFVDEYHRAFVRGSELGIQVAYSGCRGAHYSPNFCHVTGPTPNFFVSTRGMVSSCYEIIDPTSPKGRFTVYGHYDREERRFVFNEEKLRRIRDFNVTKMRHCRDCFARWNCGGDCFARSDIYLNSNGEMVGSQRSPRCYANRETTLRELVCLGLVLDAFDRSDCISS